MSICTLNILERPGRVKSFHTVSPASTGLPTLLVRCLLAQKEGCEASVSLPACRYVVHMLHIYIYIYIYILKLSNFTVNVMSGMCLSRDYMFFVKGFILCGRFLSRQYMFFLEGFKLDIVLRNKCI